MSNNDDWPWSIEDDFEFCDEMFVLIVQTYDESADLSTYRPIDQSVVTIGMSMGAICNGGFDYLFNRELDDRFCRTAIAAYRAIGAGICARAFEEAMHTFPRSKLPANQSKRMTCFRNAGESKLQAINQTFYRQSKDVWNLLADYIREHRHEFEGVT